MEEAPPSRKSLKRFKLSLGNRQNVDDFNADGRLAGIEILDAVKRLGDTTVFKQVIFEDVCSRQSRQYKRSALHFTQIPTKPYYPPFSLSREWRVLVNALATSV